MLTSTEVLGDDTRATRIVRWVLTVLISANFTLNYVAVRSLVPLDLYAAGKTGVPFRIFPILVMRAFGAVPLFHKVAAHLPMEPRSTELLALAFMVFFGMLAAARFTALTLQVLGVTPAFAGWSSLLVILLSYSDLTPSWGLNYTMAYDVPALACFCGGVWAIVANRMPWFYLIFILCTSNRETSCFLIVFYVAWAVFSRGDEPNARRVIALNAAAMAVLWVTVKLVPVHLLHSHAFAQNDSLSMLKTLRHNLRELFWPAQWPVLASACAFSLPIIWMGRRWIRNKPYALAVAVTLTCWFVVSMVQGAIVEIRIFNEWLALLTPCLVLMIYNRLRAAPVLTPLPGTPRLQATPTSEML